MENPFNITKACDFSDTQINDYWVGVNKNIHLNTQDILPKYILGGKGCGKTHLLRYYSYPLQKIRNKTVKEIILKDKYIGIYTILNGLDSSRFNGKGINQDQWETVFEYYFELYLTETFLTVAKDIFRDELFSTYTESQFVSKIVKIFHDDLGTNGFKFTTIDSLIEGIRILLRKIDSEVINAAFTRKLDYGQVKCLFASGDLMLRIPEILCSDIPELKDFKFIYILDEYEKLFEWQKVFINTLVWTKKRNCTMWIGARKYGYTTRETKNKESIKAGSEFEPVFLDEKMQEDEKAYQEFAKQLLVKRLKEFLPNEFNDEQIIENFSKKLEKFQEDEFLAAFSERVKNKEYKHIKDLRTKLNRGIKLKVIDDSLTVDAIISSLLDGITDKPLEQKFKIYLFYREWANLGSKRSKICETSTHNAKANILVNYVNDEYSKYLKKISSEFDNIREKYRSDLLSQLYQENNLKNYIITGLDSFITLSYGNPRIFLIILKLLFEKSTLSGENPLERNTIISLKSQYSSVIEASKWFYQNIDINGVDGINLYKSLTHLIDIIKLYRFSDKITETSICSFSFGEDDISEEVQRSIKLFSEHDIIIRSSERKNRNTGRAESSYQIHKILSPLWNIPFAKRGVADFSSEVMEAIFNPERFSTFSKVYSKLKSRYSAPLFGKSEGKDSDETQFLFKEE